MYETMIMVQADCTFSVEEMYALACQACPGADVHRSGNWIEVKDDDETLTIKFNSDDYVVEESNEIGHKYDRPCVGSTARYEMWGSDDPDMALFNSYFSINKRLQENGKFVIFDEVNGNFPFED